MRFETTYKLERFILDTEWDKLTLPVKERLKGCLIDLIGAMIIGSRSEQFAVGLRLAKALYGSGDIHIAFKRPTSSPLLGYRYPSCCITN